MVLIRAAVQAAAMLVAPAVKLIIAGTRAACPELPIAMTSNGVGLEHRIGGLVEAGLDRINISLDTVSRAKAIRR